MCITYFYRFYTLLVYLNDVPKEYGGSTNFKYLDLTVHPIKNTALFFNNLDEDGQPNYWTVHSGETLLTDKFEKWALNVWTRTTDFIWEDIINDEDEENS